MDRQRILTVIDKEWAEVFKNRLVLFTVAFLPLIFTALPLGVLFAMSRGPEIAQSELDEMPPAFLARCGDAAPTDCLQIFMLDQFLLLYMLMPLIIPVSIAAYSIVGEKTTRSLEPLLATPLTTHELLVGKVVSAAVPAMAATWGAFALFFILGPLFGVGPAALAHAASPTWLLAVLLLGPLMTVVAVSFAIMVSSRATDPRVAEQMAAVIIVPVLLVFFAQVAGRVLLDARFVLIAAVVFLALDIALVALAARLFQRETILTRWK